MAVHRAVAGEIFDGVLFGVVLFPHEMSWMRSRTELSQFLGIFLSLKWMKRQRRKRLVNGYITKAQFYCKKF